MGRWQSRIAKELNEDGIPSPSEYKRINNIANFRQFTDIKSLWEGHAVNKILHDERYTGKQIFGKYCSEKMRGKPIGLPEDELIVFENAHEAIISKELFDEVSGKLYTHKHVAYTVAKKPSIYKCGGCGRTLMKNRKGFYVCRYRNMNFSDSCIIDFILADELNETLYEIIKKQLSVMLGNAKKYKIIEKDSEYESEEELKNKIMRVNILIFAGLKSIIWLFVV